jgi:dihydroxy-acid dehydratase
MGTASTMTSITEAMGFSLPGASSIPAMDAAHPRMAAASGARIVDMIWEDLRPRRLLTADSVRNAIAVHMALGGSTNAVVHLIAIAGRAGIPLTLQQYIEAGGDIPVLANLYPTGDHLMEDFYYAGGLPALLKELAPRLHLECLTATGRTLGENIESAVNLDPEVIRPLSSPVVQAQALAVLRGNLAPSGAVIKPSAASERLLEHTGPALVFDSMEDMTRRIHDPELAVDENTVLVLRNGGPVGASGMPEWGNLPIPKKLLEAGVHDIVRISDSRMSGTHAGTCVLHVSPEAAVGGPLALVRTGDMIRLDVPAGRLDVLLDEAQLEERRQQWKPPKTDRKRGYLRLYVEHVSQADQGCDFDFLSGWQEPDEPVIF